MEDPRKFVERWFSESLSEDWMGDHNFNFEGPREFLEDLDAAGFMIVAKSTFPNNA